MRARTLVLIVCLFFLLPPLVAAEVFELVPVAAGVYAALGRRDAPMRIGCNAVIIVNQGDILIVDTHMTPAAAHALQAQLKSLSDKPVRYVINTHWHSDHVQGNQAYFTPFPGTVEIISHQSTREDILKKVIPSAQESLQRLPGQIAQLEEQLSRGRDAQGNPLSETEKQRLQMQIAQSKSYLEELRQMQITLPTVTFERRLVLHKSSPQGEREIHLLFFGKAHTCGDVVVYLPKEKVVITGDLLTSGLPFPRDSYPAAWVEALKALAELDFEYLIPGHGPVQQGKEHLQLVTAIFESLVTQVRAAVSRGLSLEETKKSVSLEAFRQRITGGQKQMDSVFDQRIAQTIERAYLELTGKLD